MQIIDIILKMTFLPQYEADNRHPDIKNIIDSFKQIIETVIDFSVCIKRTKPVCKELNF